MPTIDTKPLIETPKSTDILYVGVKEEEGYSDGHTKVGAFVLKSQLGDQTNPAEGEEPRGAYMVGVDGTTVGEQVRGMRIVDSLDYLLNTYTGDAEYFSIKTDYGISLYKSLGKLTVTPSGYNGTTILASTIGLPPDNRRLYFKQMLGSDGIIEFFGVNPEDSEDITQLLNYLFSGNYFSNIREVILSRGSYTISGNLGLTGSTGLTTPARLTIKSNATVIYNSSSTSTLVQIPVTVERGGRIEISSGTGLIFNHGINAGLYQIFYGDGDIVSIGEGGDTIQIIYPEWFSGSSDEERIQKALDSTIAMWGRVYFSSTYRLTTPEFLIDKQIDCGPNAQFTSPWPGAIVGPKLEFTSPNCTFNLPILVGFATGYTLSSLTYAKINIGVCNLNSASVSSQNTRYLLRVQSLTFVDVNVGPSNGSYAIDLDMNGSCIATNIVFDSSWGSASSAYIDGVETGKAFFVKPPSGGIVDNTIEFKSHQSGKHAVYNNGGMNVRSNLIFGNDLAGLDGNYIDSKISCKGYTENLTFSPNNTLFIDSLLNRHTNQFVRQTTSGGGELGLSFVSGGRFYTLELTEDITNIVFGEIPALAPTIHAIEFKVEFIQPLTGGPYTVTFPSNVHINGSPAINSTAGSRTLVEFISFDNGVTYCAKIW